MRIEVNDKERLAMFWLTNAEQNDEKLLKSLEPQYAAYKQSKYTVAVMCSGQGSLLDSMTGLLLRNRKVLAQREMAQENAATNF